MRLSLTKASLAAVAMAVATSAGAVDYAYFQSQTCPELLDEYKELVKADKAASEAMTKEKDRAARDKALGIASAVLLGFGWWRDADHSNTNMILAEIRDDLKMVTRAAKQKKCKLPGA